MAASLTISIAEAAQRLGFPKQTTERVARDLGLLIMAGNRKRIDPNDLLEIIEGCRNKPKAPVSTAGATQGSGSSATQGAGTVQQALEIAERLKGRSPSTSPNATGAQVVPLSQAR